MRVLLAFAIGALCGGMFAAWILGVPPSAPPDQITIIARPAPQPPVPIAVPLPPPPAEVTTPAAEPSPPAIAPEPPAPASPPAQTSAAPQLSRGSLTIPVQGMAAARLADSFNEVHSGQRHEAIDIIAPRGTPVIAAEDGRIVKLFTSKPGGLTVYQFDASEKFAYYYAHLDRYAPGLAEGQQVKRGDVLGYVGSSGNASPNAPHLHFAIFVLGAEKRWWQGTAINPYPILTAK